MSLMRLFSVVKKEFIHIKRDVPSLVIALLMPIIFVLLFGYAVNTDVEKIDMAILDMDKTYQSRELINKFHATRYFTPTRYLNNTGEIRRSIMDNSVDVALIIPSGFGKNIEKGEKATTQLVINGVDPTIARTALQSSVMLSRTYVFELIESSGFNLTENMERLDVRTKVWFNPDLESSKFIVPALIGLVMQNITVILTSFSLVREKEHGTIELLIVTPIRSAELIIGKMAPYVIIGTIDFLLALFLGTWWFEVPVQGSLPLLIVLGVLFVMCALAIGMLISSIADNQAQAMQMALLFLLPSVILSGFMFPREAMPLPIYTAGFVLPVTYFINILRDIILKGADFSYLVDDTIALGVLTVVLLIIASTQFKKRLD
ncbi:ABC transporter permease [Fusibacter sp. JL216-2]|uniref:ABC transporter permease n=1 Tax=Fusibacter sp. JL216-2 TaxID=3071453 RepID=UPI003D35444C